MIKKNKNKKDNSVKTVMHNVILYCRQLFGPKKNKNKWQQCQKHIQDKISYCPQSFGANHTVHIDVTSCFHAKLTRYMSQKKHAPYLKTHCPQCPQRLSTMPKNVVHIFFKTRVVRHMFCEQRVLHLCTCFHSQCQYIKILWEQCGWHMTTTIFITKTPKTMSTKRINMLTVLITKKKLEIKKKKKWNIPYTAIYTKNITINTTTNAKIDVSILMYGRRKKKWHEHLAKIHKKMGIYTFNINFAFV